MAKAYFRFHGELNYFLERRLKNQRIDYPFEWRASVKDMLEAIAPPHPEVELVLVNGRSVTWDYVVQDADEIEAYPNFDAVELADKKRLFPPYPKRPSFILDTHLGRLAAYLRMLGFDTLYRNDYDDDELAEGSASETRILLTRDIGALKRGIVTYGYFVRNTNPNKQIVEISQRYGLAAQMQAFKRCMKCNGELQSVEKASIKGQIPDDTYDFFPEFHQCSACQQIYWKGSHFEKMEKLIQEVLEQVG